MEAQAHIHDRNDLAAQIDDALHEVGHVGNFRDFLDADDFNDVADGNGEFLVCDVKGQEFILLGIAAIVIVLPRVFLRILLATFIFRHGTSSPGTGWIFPHRTVTKR